MASDKTQGWQLLSYQSHLPPKSVQLSIKATLVLLVLFNSQSPQQSMFFQAVGKSPHESLSH